MRKLLKLLLVVLSSLAMVGSMNLLTSQSYAMHSVDHLERVDQIVGGMNVSEWSKNSGISFQQLKEDLKPDNSSSAGFLGTTESLEKVLTEDHEFVVHQMGLSHLALAQPLFDIQKLDPDGKGQVVYRNYSYSVKTETWRGIQMSPFHDRTVTNVDITVTLKSTGKTIRFSGLLPEMIIRYGFYEGKETPYRLDPREILEVFPFLCDSISKT